MRSVAAWCLVVIGGTVMAHGAPPVPVIFDTDMCGDCDDVAALAMLHALESREQCRLLAVTVSASHPRAAPFVDCVNHFYGRTGIPVGVVRPGGVVVVSARPWRKRGELVDLPSAVITAGTNAGLLPLERAVALLAAVRDGHLIARPSFFQLQQVRKARAGGIPMHLIAHEDVLVFGKPHRRGNGAVDDPVR